MADVWEAERTPDWFGPPWFEVSFDSLFAHEFSYVLGKIFTQRPHESASVITNELHSELDRYSIDVQWRIVHRVWDAVDVLDRLRRRLERVRLCTDTHDGFDYLSDDDDMSWEATSLDVHHGTTFCEELAAVEPQAGSALEHFSNRDDPHSKQR